MDPDAEGILKLGGCYSKDDIDSLNRLFHWQQEDYEMFSPSCNVLSVDEEEPDKYPPKYREYKAGEATMDTIPAHQFKNKEAMKYEEPMVKLLNLDTEIDEKIILVGDDWNPVWKTAAFKILILLLLLMYGQEAVVPVEFMVPSFWIAMENRLGDRERERLHTLWTLDERIHDGNNGTKLKLYPERMDPKGGTEQPRGTR